MIINIKFGQFVLSLLFKKQNRALRAYASLGAILRFVTLLRNHSPTSIIYGQIPMYRAPDDGEVCAVTSR